MKRLSFWILAAAVAAAMLSGTALAEYGRSLPADPRGESEKPAEESSAFDRAVDLNRFRRGNPEWDTQELIASGLKALHQEHQVLLRQIKALSARIDNLEGKR